MRDGGVGRTRVTRRVESYRVASDPVRQLGLFCEKNNRIRQNSITTENGRRHHVLARRKFTYGLPVLVLARMADNQWLSFCFALLVTRRVRTGSMGLTRLRIITAPSSGEQRQPSRGLQSNSKDEQPAGTRLRCGPPPLFSPSDPSCRPPFERQLD